MLSLLSSPVPTLPPVQPRKGGIGGEKLWPTAAKKALLLNKSFSFGSDDDSLQDLTPLWGLTETPEQTQALQKVPSRGRGGAGYDRGLMLWQ